MASLEEIKLLENKILIASVVKSKLNGLNRIFEKVFLEEFTCSSKEFVFETIPNLEHIDLLKNPLFVQFLQKNCLDILSGRRELCFITATIENSTFSFDENLYVSLEYYSKIELPLNYIYFIKKLALIQ